MPKRKKKYGDRKITATSEYTRKKGAMIVSLYEQGLSYKAIVEAVHAVGMSLQPSDLTNWRDEDCYKIGRKPNVRTFAAAMQGAEDYTANGITDRILGCATGINTENWKAKESEARILCMYLNNRKSKDRGRSGLDKGKGKGRPIHVAYTYSVPENPLVDGEETEEA